RDGNEYVSSDATSHREEAAHCPLWVKSGHGRSRRDVCFVPKADSCSAAKRTPIRSPRRRAAGQHFYQLAKPNEDRKRSKHLEQYGSNQDYAHIAYHAAQNPLR